MESRSWLWRKLSSEKTVVATNKSGFSAKGIDEQKHQNLNEVGPVCPVKNLNEMLDSVLLDCPAKDVLVTRHEKLAPETIQGDSVVCNASSTGPEIAEEEIVRLKQEVDEARSEGLAANERLAHANAALKQCMQQLNLFREEQEQKIHDAVMKARYGFQITQKRLEEKLMDTTNKLADLDIENTNLSNALLLKEKLVEELHKQASQAEAEFDVLLARLDSTEKENVLLKYEFHMLEKELEVRSEELDYNRQSADALRRQCLESEKKVSKLEAECQRLRVLMRKKLPGPAALAKRPIPARDLILRDTATEKSSVNLLIEQLQGVEEENRSLKETITKKNAELQSSRTMLSRTASRLSQVEAQVIELSAGQKPMEIAVSTGSDNGVSSSESWASALISELEPFKDEKLKSPSEQKAIRVSDMSLMDDFVEMEKLAIFSVQSPERGNRPMSAGNELIPVKQDHSGYGDKKQEHHVEDAASDKSFDWLQVVLKAIFKQERISKRSVTDLLEDVKIALGFINYVPDPDITAVSEHATESEVSGCMVWKSPDTSSIVSETSTQCGQSNLNKSVHKIIELIEGINVTSMVGNDTNGSKKVRGSSPLAQKDYFVRVFHWRSSELSDVIRQFVQICHGLLSGKTGLESFVDELSFTLDWILSNHVRPEDASNKLQSEITKDVSAQTEGLDCNFQEENKRLNDELKNMETRLHSAIKDLLMKLQESEQSTERLQTEVKSEKESKRMIEDQLENLKSTNEDLGTQLQVSKANLNEVLQQLSALEIELEDKCNCCEDLEATCLELQLQLESVAKKRSQNYSSNEDGKQPQTGWDITATSVKLAECQETILNLGKQLKALASPREAALFDQVFAATSATTISTNNKIMRRHFSLHDQMKAEDNAKAIILRSPIEDAQRSSLNHSENALALITPPNKTRNNAVTALAIVPSKKQGGIGLLRRLLMRKKRGSMKRSSSHVKV